MKASDCKSTKVRARPGQTESPEDPSFQLASPFGQGFCWPSGLTQIQHRGLRRPNSHCPGGIWKRRCKIFSVHYTTTEEFKNATINGHSGFVSLWLRKPKSRKSHNYRHVIVFENLCFMCRQKRKAGVLKFLQFERCFGKAPLRDILVWTVCLTVEIKLRFTDISLAECRHNLKNTFLPGIDFDLIMYTFCRK